MINLIIYEYISFITLTMERKNMKKCVFDLDKTYVVKF